MTMQLINAPSVCTELARSETFGKIKMFGSRAKVSSCMLDIVAQQGRGDADANGEINKIVFCGVSDSYSGSTGSLVFPLADLSY